MEFSWAKRLSHSDADCRVLDELLNAVNDDKELDNSIRQARSWRSDVDADIFPKAKAARRRLLGETRFGLEQLAADGAGQTEHPGAQHDEGPRLRNAT